MIPTVLRTDLYAVAALAGAAIVVIGDVLHLPSVAVTIAGALLCFALRLMAIRLGWRLPNALSPERSARGVSAPDDQREEDTGRR